MFIYIYSSFEKIEETGKSGEVWSLSERKTSLYAL